MLKHQVQRGRSMGLIPENKENYILGSAIHYAKNLEGNLLFVHGTGDDNVQYDNAEALLNELIKYNKQFQFMPYPNRGPFHCEVNVLMYSGEAPTCCAFEA